MIASCKKAPNDWDLIVVGGGATGLGAALDAASRGYRTLLLEQSDFAKGTSSRSTKLVHGGLRYLKQGYIHLVMGALKERGILCQNAPHLVTHLPFLIPLYRWWEAPFYRIGLKIYDWLAGKRGFEKSEHLSREETLLRIPTLEPKNLRGGAIYYDGQFDDARLAIALAQTCADLGGILVNYMPVTALLKKEGRVAGVRAKDLESGEEYTFRAKVVINATGVFSDALRHMDDPSADPIIKPSQGIHLVLDRSFMPSDTAILIPQTEDGRVLFFVPWQNHLLLGTTDTPVERASLDPLPMEEEVEFLLSYASRYLIRHPKKSDILSVFVGLRPLVETGKEKNTAAISRDHAIVVSASGLITIAGGKWTTYRKMGQDVIDQAAMRGKLRKTPCLTATLPLHEPEKQKTQELLIKHPEWGKPLHPRLPYLPAEIVWAVREEMARTLEDVLARRTRALFLDVHASLDIAPRVAELMAHELGQGSDWQKEQLENYGKIARGYFFL
jgi:glycerol-3-phosphate dehydrogenase